MRAVRVACKRFVAATRVQLCHHTRTAMATVVPCPPWTLGRQSVGCCRSPKPVSIATGCPPAVLGNKVAGQRQLIRVLPYRMPRCSRGNGRTATLLRLALRFGLAGGLLVYNRRVHALTVSGSSSNVRVSGFEVSLAQNLCKALFLGGEELIRQGECALLAQTRLVHDSSKACASSDKAGLCCSAGIPSSMPPPLCMAQCGSSLFQRRGGGGCGVVVLERVGERGKGS